MPRGHRASAWPAAAKSPLSSATSPTRRSPDTRTKGGQSWLAAERAPRHRRRRRPATTPRTPPAASAHAPAPPTVRRSVRPNRPPCSVRGSWRRAAPTVVGGSPARRHRRPAGKSSVYEVIDRRPVGVAGRPAPRATTPAASASPARYSSGMKWSGVGTARAKSPWRAASTIVAGADVMMARASVVETVRPVGARVAVDAGP